MNAIGTRIEVAASAPPGLAAEELSFRFDGRLLFDRLSFVVPGGGFTVLLGESGVGKTSLLKIVAGLLRPEGGRVVASDGLPVPGRAAYMGQQDLLLPWLDVLGNVTLGARLRGDAVDRPWAEHLIERVGLKGRQRAMPTTLSGGMRQRAALARTLYERRPIVLMDEPFSALDAITRTGIQDLAAELLGDSTVLLITHDPMEACRLGTSLLVMTGQPARLGTPFAVEGRPPRAPDDADLLRSQGRLLRMLAERAT